MRQDRLDRPVVTGKEKEYGSTQNDQKIQGLFQGPVDNYRLVGIVESKKQTVVINNWCGRVVVNGT